MTSFFYSLCKPATIKVGKWNPLHVSSLKGEQPGYNEFSLDCTPQAWHVIYLNYSIDCF